MALTHRYFASIHVSSSSSSSSSSFFSPMPTPSRQIKKMEENGRKGKQSINSGPQEKRENQLGPATNIQYFPRPKYGWSSLNIHPSPIQFQNQPTFLQQQITHHFKSPLITIIIIIIIIIIILISAAAGKHFICSCPTCAIKLLLRSCYVAITFPVNYSARYKKKSWAIGQSGNAAMTSGWRNGPNGRSGRIRRHRRRHRALPLPLPFQSVCRAGINVNLETNHWIFLFLHFWFPEEEKKM